MIDVTNILVSAFQNHIKICSCQISLDSDSYELVTWILRAGACEKESVQNQVLTTHNNGSLTSNTCFSVLLTILGLWVVGQGGNEVWL